MAREELGTKRTCPETGKKFYDLNKDPIVSPYSGKSYPLSYFQEVAIVKVRKEAAKVVEKEEEEVEAEEEADEDAPEFVSLEDADGDEAEDDVPEDEEIPDLPDVEVEDDETDDEAFLEEEDEDDDLSDVLGSEVEGEEEV